ncbi:cell wall adhesin EAP1-like [Brachypodium distachyon]|uniref:cell wall adhesin EAP1-like n=1 Tax=Brachypodium distachyon TaxID=15368 RepID=UPI00071C5E24|nr:cell wall adhesin EAP1-like [Brachypodium distachyon]|eukprot:XP_014756069.1 cell wall adhesin EAP1-like [Brachypodium distachyon]
MSDSPARAPQSPPPAARGKQATEESEGGPDSSWPGDESSGDEAGRVARAQTVLPEAEVEDEDDAPLVRRPRVPTAATTSASAASAVEASPATGAAATPRGSAAPPKRGIFRGYSLRLNPSKDNASVGAGKRGRTDTTPAAPSKKPRTRASVSASQASTQASSAAFTPAADPVPEEEEPAAGETRPATDSPAAEAGTEGDKSPPTSTAAPQGPDAPTTGADDTVIDLTSEVEDAELRDEPEVAPAPIPAAPDTTVVAPTAATGVGLDGASPVLQVREHHELAKGQLGEVRQEVERERQELSQLREETRLAWQARDEAATPVISEAELHWQLEAQRTELQQVLDSLAAAQERANKEHEEVLATAQTRLNEKSELVSSYSS